MTRLFNFLFFIFLLPLTLYSQTVQIKGSVVDSLTREPLPYATIQVINISNKTVFAGIADSLASFNFSKVDVKNGFMVMVSYVGYQPKEIPFNIKLHQKTLDFGFIALMPDINLINEVQVTGQRKVQNLLDRIVYVMDSTILSKAIGTPDILSSLPEIMVNPITLETKIKGKENSLVLVNGINTGRSIDIRSINPRDIEKVEVITSPPSSVDVDYDGVINIVLKREPRKGYSGDFDATFMPSGRYIDAYSGIVIGGKKIRTNIVYTNYLRNNSWESSEIRNNTLTNESYKTNGYCNNPFEITHSFLFNLDYYPSPNNFINISTQNSLARVDKDISFKPIIINNGTSTSLTPFSIRNNSEYFIGNYTIYYKRKFIKEGNSLTANINLHYMDGDEYSDYSYEGSPTNANDENGKKQSANIKVEYINQISNVMRLTAGVQTYYQKFNGTLSGSILGNDFFNLRYNGYTDLYLNLKGFDINLGLKAEQNENKFTNTSFASTSQQALFPTLIISKQLNKVNRLKVEYRRTTFYPSAWTLSPYRIEIDSMTALIGNPMLSPSVRDAVELSHSFRKLPFSINSTVYFHSTNKLVSSNKSYDSNAFCTITYNNSADRIRTGIRVSGTIILFQFIEIEPNFNLFYEEYHNDGVTRHNSSYSSYLMISMGLPKGFGIGAFGSYNGKLLHAQGYADPNYSLDAVFIMKRFYKQNLNLYAGLRGLSKSKEKSFTYDGDIEGIYTFKHDTYGFAFRITYLFNVGKKYDMEKINTHYETDKK